MVCILAWSLLARSGEILTELLQQFLLAAGLSYEKSSRATNMTYTSMLFALAFDRFIFGQTPGFMSIIGSTLILGSAVYMAVRRDAGRGNNDVDEGSIGGANREVVGRGDEEEGMRLMGAMEGGEVEGTENSAPVQSVEMRSLR